MLKMPLQIGERDWQWIAHCWIHMPCVKKYSDEWLFAMQPKNKCTAAYWWQRRRFTPTPIRAVYFQHKIILCQKLIELRADLLNQYFLRILSGNTWQPHNNNHFTRDPVKQTIRNPHNLCRT